jgi:uncharacterized protein (DUF1778 family)
MAKSGQLQIRVSPAQKTQLRRLAAAAGLDVSAYVLARALPDSSRRVHAAIVALRDESRRRFALAELTDAIAPLGADALAAAVEGVDVARLSPFAQNYVAAIVEEACAIRDIPPPTWTERVEPLSHPWFATELKSVRLHLLRNSPAAFKRRNLFVDASSRERV